MIFLYAIKCCVNLPFFHYVIIFLVAERWPVYPLNYEIGLTPSRICIYYAPREEIERYFVSCDERTKITNNISDHPPWFLDSQLTLLLRMALRRHGKGRLYFKTPAYSIRPKFKTNFRSNFYTLPPQLRDDAKTKKDCRNRESVRGLKFGVALGQRF